MWRASTLWFKTHCGNVAMFFLGLFNRFVCAFFVYCCVCTRFVKGFSLSLWQITDIHTLLGFMHFSSLSRRIIHFFFACQSNWNGLKGLLLREKKMFAFLPFMAIIIIHWFLIKGSASGFTFQHNWWISFGRKEIQMETLCTFGKNCRERAERMSRTHEHTNHNAEMLLTKRGYFRLLWILRLCVLKEVERSRRTTRWARVARRHWRYRPAGAERESKI